MTRERLIPLGVAAAALLTLTACSADGPGDPATAGPDTTTATPTTSPDGGDTITNPTPRPIGFASARLEFFGDCPALLSYMQDEAGQRVTAWGLGGGPYWYGEPDMALVDDMAAESDVAEGAPRVAAGGEAGVDFSGTNVQEVGVDEGDIVETDGEYVYVATSDGLRIVSITDAAVVAEPPLPQGAHQLLLDGSRLLVVTSSWGGSPDTIVSLFDVTDPPSPSLLRRSHLEGSIVATRAIDGVARLVISTNFDQRLPFVQPDQFGFDEEAALERNQEIISESNVEDWLPRWFDEAGDGSFGAMQPALPCEDVAAPPDFAGLGVTWIGSLDMQAEATPVGSAGIVSTGDIVYASTDNLYVATQNWDWRWGGPVPLPEPMPVDDLTVESAPGAPTGTVEPRVVPPPTTVDPTAPPTTEPATTEPSPPTTEPVTTVAPTVPAETPAPSTTVPATVPPTTVAPDTEPGPPPTLIHQFRLDGGTDASYVASGMVEGRLLNQFAMSEHDGDLRVATTTDDWGRFGDQSESTVFVLRPNADGELDQISAVGGLGKGEQIYAVRFMGDVAYVVTFRRIDPLYVLDLSDPANPVLDGELKIPGYSAYLHPVGDGLLLGVGQDATDEGRATGTQLSLFDVSAPTNPQRIDTLTIGGQSEVEWDHKAFLFWEPDGTIVLPVSPGWGNCPPGAECLADDLDKVGGGAVVAELDGRELSARGSISHTTDGYRGCWNPLQRSIAVNDELVTVGFDQVKFSDRQSLEPRDSVSWGDPEQYGCSWYE